jgi:hypothetical protein
MIHKYAMRRLRAREGLLLLVVPLCLGVVCATHGRPLFRSAPAAFATAPAPAQEPQDEYYEEEDATLLPEPDGGPPVLVIYATPYGLEPEQTEVRPGAHVVMIRNATGLENLAFTVTRPGHDALLQGGAGPGRTITGKVPFAPGEAFVTEASHPDWVCRIVVTP